MELRTDSEELENGGIEIEMDRVYSWQEAKTQGSWQKMNECQCWGKGEG